MWHITDCRRGQAAKGREQKAEPQSRKGHRVGSRKKTNRSGRGRGLDWGGWRTHLSKKLAPTGLEFRSQAGLVVVFATI